MKTVKFKIIKPSSMSGYHTGYIGEVLETQIEGIRKHNEIEILSETEEEVKPESVEVKQEVKKPVARKRTSTKK